MHAIRFTISTLSIGDTSWKRNYSTIMPRSWSKSSWLWRANYCSGKQVEVALTLFGSLSKSSKFSKIKLIDQWHFWHFCTILIPWFFKNFSNNKVASNGDWITNSQSLASKTDIYLTLLIRHVLVWRSLNWILFHVPIDFLDLDHSIINRAWLCKVLKVSDLQAMTG